MICLYMAFFFVIFFFFFKQKTAYEMRISDWSSDVCSSDLIGADPFRRVLFIERVRRCAGLQHRLSIGLADRIDAAGQFGASLGVLRHPGVAFALRHFQHLFEQGQRLPFQRSEEHTSELQSLMRISYAVFCLKKKNYRATNMK